MQRAKHVCFIYVVYILFSCRSVSDVGTRTYTYVVCEKAQTPDVQTAAKIRGLIDLRAFHFAKPDLGIVKIGTYKSKAEFYI